MERLLFFGIPLALGIIIGTQLTIWFQLGIIAAYIVFTSTSRYAAMEIGTIFIDIMFWVLCIGMVIGDISFLFQTGYLETINWFNPFKVQS